MWKGAADEPENHDPTKSLVDADFNKENLALHEEEATLRDTIIDQVHYRMEVELNEKFEDGYTGSTKITFNVKDPSAKNLFIDFQG